MIATKIVNRNTKIKNFNTLSIYAKTWRANIQANGGTINPAVLSIFDNYFFKPAAAAGNILDQLDRLNFYAGTGNETAARTNVINNNFFVSKVNAPIWDNSQGYRSAGTGYLNLNYNPKTQGVKNVLNSSSHLSVVKTPTFASTIRFMGAAQSGSINQQVLTRLSVPRLDALTNSNLNTQNTNTTSIGNVFFAGLRQNSTQQSAIINSNTQTSLVASIDLPNLEIYELCVNFAGGPLGGFDTSFHLCSGHGSGSLNITSLRTILNNLFTALGI